MTEIKVGQIYRFYHANLGSGFSKIISVTDETLCYLVYGEIDNRIIAEWMINWKDSYNIKLKKNNLLDKIPARFEEVEEEVPIFVLNRETNNYMQIGVIKKKITKELNFNWETGEWE